MLACLLCSGSWYTSMVGRKTNLKPLVARARAAGATMVKTTEFVQGRTSRWGLAWSFASPAKAIAGVKGAAKASRMSFTLEVRTHLCVCLYGQRLSL